jgi:hypothetical protein
MLKMDHFASIFRAADKELLLISEVLLSKVVLVTDVSREESLEIWERWKGILPNDVELVLFDQETSRSLSNLVQRIDTLGCDLIITYRCLHSDAWKYPFAIGSHVEVLTQVSSCPVLLMPDPRENMDPFTDASLIMLMSGDLSQEGELVGLACGIRGKEAEIILTQLEDNFAMKRLLSLISKIPQIDTDVAERAIFERIEREAEEWVNRCSDLLSQRENPPKITHMLLHEPTIEDCVQLMRNTKPDMLVINTKDDEQLAIHGLAYPLMVQFRNLPLLLR